MITEESRLNLKLADASTDRGYGTRAGGAAATKIFPHHTAKLHDHPQTPEHGH